MHFIRSEKLISNLQLSSSTMFIRFCWLFCSHRLIISGWVGLAWPDADENDNNQTHTRHNVTHFIFNLNFIPTNRIQCNCVIFLLLHSYKNARNESKRNRNSCLWTFCVVFFAFAFERISFLFLIIFVSFRSKEMTHKKNPNMFVAIFSIYVCGILNGVRFDMFAVALSNWQALIW